MERENRQKISSVIDYILQNAPKFSFIQAVRLLRFFITDGYKKEINEKDLESQIKTRPKLSFDFPGTDIVRIDKIDENSLKFLITVTFLGLYGSSSPLPAFYTEDLLEEKREDKSIMRDFLDIINMPLYPLLFKIWSKYQLPYKVIEEKDADTIQKWYDLIGLGEKEFRDKLKYVHVVLRYVELITQFPRSAEALCQILQDALCLKQVDIIQCVEQTLVIDKDQRCRLGIAGNKLGEDCVVGQCVQDRMGKFRLVVEVDNEDTLFRLLPDGKDFEVMEELIHFYLTSPLKWDLELKIKPKIIKTTCLGSTKWNRLGWNTWLFSDKIEDKQPYVRLSP
ncbi:MAG: type VI secretion system baseplate subunit TssG [Desulfonauticus sp.]|nr:type VI secretion system baseplate subunit TssG [Desulfonauticus sp.]